jgi:hypothetical protein
VNKQFYRKMINRTTTACFKAGVAAVCVLGLSAQLVYAAERVYYRYINEKGSQVIEHSISPEYAQKGYEVVTASGKVIKVVPPALSGEEAAKHNAAKAEAELLAEWDAKLTRRYSKVADIEAAKKRKLVELEGNITILKGNLRGIKSQVAQQQARAADIERAGREVPEAVVNNIQALEKEVVITEQQIDLRQDEFNQVAARFDKDMERFRVIRPDK